MALQNIILKQLAFENANEECRSVLRPIRETGSLMEYLKHVGTTYLCPTEKNWQHWKPLMYKKLLMPNVLTVGSPAI